jgi:hypothetical protein
MAIIGVALARNAEESQRVVVAMSCDSSAAVGDLVYQDSVQPTKAVVATNNTTVNQVIGAIYSKGTPTTCKVITQGLIDVYSGLSVGGRVFLSTAGTLTQTPPSTGYVHNLGLAVSSSSVLFIANNVRVKRS